MKIWNRLFHYLKLLLVHPSTEIVLRITYITSFIIIGILIFKESSNYDDHQILDLTETYLSFDLLDDAKTPSNFSNYLNTILKKMFRIDGKNDEIPLFIPSNPIRIIPFMISNDCNTQIYYNKSCDNTYHPHRFNCVIEYLSESFKHKCGEKYSDSTKMFEKKFTGYYYTYNLRDVKDFVDITNDTYQDKLNKIDNYINDKQLKAIILQINLIVPSNDNFVDVILGVEMTNYFTNVKSIFSVYVLNNNRPKTKIILYIIIIIYIITNIIIMIKLMFEINIKPIWLIHLFNVSLRL